MEKENMTALMCTFVKAYHYKNNKFCIYGDKYAEKLLGEDYQAIANNLTKGINYFNPNFSGNSDEALKWIVNNKLAGNILARSIYEEKALKNAIKFGACEYLIFATGYSLTSLKFNLLTFELDRKEVIEDKQKRLCAINLLKGNISYLSTDLVENDWKNTLLQSNYDKNKISFSSLLGISYYLTKTEFEDLIKNIADIIKDGSTIVFDYPDLNYYKNNAHIVDFAKGANDEMKVSYSFTELEKMLQKYDLLIYEHLNDKQMTINYLENYNTLNPNNKIIAPSGVNYLLTVKKSMNK